MTLLTTALRLLNVLLMVGVPVGLALWIYRRGRPSMRPIWIGVAGFLLSQVGHIPFNQFLMLPLLESRGISAAAQAGMELVVLGVAAGLSAGIFEELTRYLIFRFWLKEDRHELLPIKYGIGHGGIEAVLLGLLALVAFIQVLFLGGEGTLQSFDPEQAALIRSQIEAYWAIPWQLSLLGAWERVSAMAFHVGASILVYKSVREKNLLWLLGAVLGHTLVNAYAVIFLPRLDLVLLEGILFVFAVIWLVWAWSIRPQDPDQDPPTQEPLPEPTAPEPKLTAKQLEESRYDE